MQQPPSNAAGSGQIPSMPSLGQYQQDGASSQNLGSASEVRSLWIGNLSPWMNEGYLKTIFRETAKVVSARVVRNMQTGQSKGYGFVEFINHSVAETVLQTYNGAKMPKCKQTFRLNWVQTFYYIYVGNLAPEVTDDMLMETFKNVYTSVQEAYVETDKITGRKKTYGFVRFGDENEQMRAISEMNGQWCSTRPMRIALAKKPLTMQPAKYQSTQIFVGGLNASVTDDELKSVFGEIGEIVEVKILPGKHCGFVKFANRKCAEDALSKLNGAQLGGQSIRLSWTRGTQNGGGTVQAQWNSGGTVQAQWNSGGTVQAQWNSGGTVQAQWNGGGYYVYYAPYGYASHYPPPQNPSAYYGGYTGYENYQHQQ